MYYINNLPQNIDIGYIGEKNFRKIEIDMTDWMEEMPDGVPSIVFIRPRETVADAYIVSTTFADNILTWTVTAGDLGSVEGIGTAQIWLEEEENDTVNKRGKSALVPAIVHSSVGEPSSTVPSAQTAWLEQMTALKVATVNANEAAQAAKEEIAGFESNAEAWAVGQRGGVDVGSSDATYHNNSKYYAGQAGDSASTASGYKTAAEAAKDAALAAIAHYPYVDSTTGKWMVWDVSTGAFVSTDVDAQGPQGNTGPTGQDGTSAYLWIRYASAQPTQDSDMKTTPDEWIGVHTGTESSAPTHYTDYTWYKIKGETGSAANVYGNTVPMSSTDTTKVSEAIAAKLDANQGSANSGKALRIGNDGALAPETVDTAPTQSSARLINSNAVYETLPVPLTLEFDNSNGATATPIAITKSGDFTDYKIVKHEITGENRKKVSSGVAVMNLGPSGLQASVVVKAGQTANVVIWLAKNANLTWSGPLFLDTMSDEWTLLENLKKDIAIVEDGNAASQNISKGSYVLWKGVFKQANQAIASGTTLSSTNLDDVTSGVGGELTSLSEQIVPLTGNTKWADWTEITSYTNGQSWNGSYYAKIGKITYLRISVKGLTANTQTEIFTLPTGYKPMFAIEFDGFGGGAYLNHAHCKVSDDGKVYVYSADTYAVAFIAYPSL